MSYFVFFANGQLRKEFGGQSGSVDSSLTARNDVAISSMLDHHVRTTVHELSNFVLRSSGLNAFIHIFSASVNTSVSNLSVMEPGSLFLIFLVNRWEIAVTRSIIRFFKSAPINLWRFGIFVSRPHRQRGKDSRETLTQSSVCKWENRLHMSSDLMTEVNIFKVIRGRIVILAAQRG